MTRHGIGARDATAVVTGSGGDASTAADPPGAPTPSGARPAGPDQAAVVLLTADDMVHEAVRRCAAQAGAPVTVYHDLGSLQPNDTDVELLLIGADLAAAATKLRPPPAQQVIVVSPHAPDFPAFCAAAALRATYLTCRRTDRAWLVDQLAAAATATDDRR